MTRAEFVQRIVLESICDDFENVDQVILAEVAEVGGKCGLTVQRSEVVEALRALIEAGFAKAYDISSARADPLSAEIEGMPPLDMPEEDFRTYFYVTPRGMGFHESSTALWPLDDEGMLRSGWEPPEG